MSQVPTVVIIRLKTGETTIPGVVWCRVYGVYLSPKLGLGWLALAELGNMFFLRTCKLANHIMLLIECFKIADMCFSYISIMGRCHNYPKGRGVPNLSEI